MINVVAVIPAFEPTPHLTGLVNETLPTLRGVVIVDDGSSESAQPVFRTVSAQSGVRLVRHPANRGKGAALKTGFAAARTFFPGLAGVVTADADGQHRAEDVRRIAASVTANPRRLTLGVRRFRLGSVPFRSWWGNRWTSLEFLLFTGRWIEDTQSGLRGIPTALLDDVQRLAGDRYDYEIRMLVEAQRREGIRQLPIETVYLDGNATSHFRPWADTLATQRALLSACRRRAFPRN